MTEIQGRIEFVNEYKGKTAKDIRTKMDEVMASRGEGLVLKHPGSQYVLNGRNKDWIKVRLFLAERSRQSLHFEQVKPEYMVFFALYDTPSYPLNV